MYFSKEAAKIELAIVCGGRKDSPSCGEPVIGIALDNFLEEFADDHERDASLRRIRALHCVDETYSRIATDRKGRRLAAVWTASAFFDPVLSKNYIPA